MRYKVEGGMAVETAIPAQVRGALPRPTTTKPLAPEQKWLLAQQYMDGDELARRRLIEKWGRGRVRRSLAEFAHHLHELEFTILKAKEEV